MLCVLCYSKVFGDSPTDLGIKNIETKKVKEITNSLETKDPPDRPEREEPRLAKIEESADVETQHSVKEMSHKLQENGNENNETKAPDETEEIPKINEETKETPQSEEMAHNLELLVKKLGLMEEEVQEESDVFYEKYPNGEMTKIQFIDHCLADGESKDHAESMFNVFDVDGSGTMDFVEFMMANNASTLK